MLLEVSTEHGEIETDEREMLYKVFDFAEKEVADVMVPAARRRRALDRPRPGGGDGGDARGAVHAVPGLPGDARRDRRDPPRPRPRRLAPQRRRSATSTLAELLRPPYVVPETKDLGALLAEFRRTNQHMAVVVDEYGATAGIVTLEDLLEEIVGDIEDEFDLPNESVERVSETTVRIDGSFTIDDFNEEFGTALDTRTSTPSPGSSSGTSGARRRSATRSPRSSSASACSRRAARGSSASRSSSCRPPSARTTRRKQPDRRETRRADATHRSRGSCSNGRWTRRSGIATSRSTSARRSRPRSRSRCRSSRSAGRCTRSTATRSTSGSSASRCSCRCRCSRFRPATSPTGIRGARSSIVCDRDRRARRGRAAPRHARRARRRPGRSSRSPSAPGSPRRSARPPVGR